MRSLRGCGRLNDAPTTSNSCSATSLQRSKMRRAIIRQAWRATPRYSAVCTGHESQCTAGHRGPCCKRTCQTATSRCATSVQQSRRADGRSERVGPARCDGGLAGNCAGDPRTPCAADRSLRAMCVCAHISPDMPTPSWGRLFDSLTAVRDLRTQSSCHLTKACRGIGAQASCSYVPGSSAAKDSSSALDAQGATNGRGAGDGPRAGCDDVIKTTHNVSACVSVRRCT